MLDALVGPELRAGAVPRIQLLPARAGRAREVTAVSSPFARIQCRVIPQGLGYRLQTWPDSGIGVP